MKIPNAHRAMIDERKLASYLLNPEHKRGGPKARLLIRLGYNQQQPQRLAEDLRRQHLTSDVAEAKRAEFGMKYVIIGPIRTPSDRVRLFQSIWQIDDGNEFPRLITMYPA